MQELNVEIEKSILLEKLRENKQRFATSYEALLKAYDKKAKNFQKQYGEYLEKVKARKVKDNYKEQPNPPQKPQDRTKDYDFYINMIEQHKKATIQLSEDIFRKLWMDKWDWINTHIHALQFYADDADVAAALNFYTAGE